MSRIKNDIHNIPGKSLMEKTAFGYNKLGYAINPA